MLVSTMLKDYLHQHFGFVVDFIHSFSSFVTILFYFFHKSQVGVITVSQCRSQWATQCSYRDLSLDQPHRTTSCW